jgi:hypothetical protein
MSKFWKEFFTLLVIVVLRSKYSSLKKPSLFMSLNLKLSLNLTLKSQILKNQTLKNQRPVKVRPVKLRSVKARLVKDEKTLLKRAYLLLLIVVDPA